MTQEYPEIELPDNYFADGERVFSPDFGSVQDRKPKLAKLLNSIRSSVGVGTSFYVYPGKSGMYQSIQEAFESGKKSVSPGRTIVIELQPGFSYNEDLYFENTHDIVIRSVDPQFVTDSRTLIRGTINFQPYEYIPGTERPRLFSTQNVSLGDGNSRPIVFNGQFGWTCIINDALINSGTFNKTHRIDVSPALNCILRFNRVTWQNRMRFIDLNNTTSSMTFRHSNIIIEIKDPNRTFVCRGGFIDFENCIFDIWQDGVGSMFELNNRSFYARFNNCSFKFFAFDMDLSIYSNINLAGYAHLYWLGSCVFSEMFALNNILRFPTGMTNFGAPDVIAKSFNVLGDSIPLGLRRRDLGGVAPTYKDLFWDGAAWV